MLTFMITYKHNFGEVDNILISFEIDKTGAVSQSLHRCKSKSQEKKWRREHEARKTRDGIAACDGNGNLYTIYRLSADDDGSAGGDNRRWT